MSQKFDSYGHYGAELRILLCGSVSGFRRNLEQCRHEFASMMPISDGSAFLVSEHKRIASFRHLPRQDEIGPVLLHLRTSTVSVLFFSSKCAISLSARPRRNFEQNGPRRAKSGAASA
jgi:hypothetical protein